MILEPAVIDDFNSGATLETLSSRYGLSVPTLRCRIKKMGLKRAKPSRKLVLAPAALAKLVVDYNSGMDTEALASRYGFSTTTLYQILRENKVPMRFQFTEEDIVNDYVIEKLTFRQIGKKRHASPNTIAPILEKHGIPFRNNRAYDIDETVFDTIDERAAYFLGLFCADGWITGIYNGKPTYAIGVGLDKNDVELLDQIRVWLKTDRPYYKQRGMLALTLTNQKLWLKVHELGLGHKKFNRLSIPTCINGALLNHFIRGVFDGDGSITTKRGQLKWQICGYEPFLFELQAAIERATSIKTNYRFVQFNSDGTRFGDLSFSGNLQAPALFKWMYHGSTLKMTRKHTRYVEHQRRYSEWLKSQEVCEVDAQGNVIATYASKSAAAKAVGCSTRRICDVIFGNKRSYMGRHFIGSTERHLHRQLRRHFV